MPIYLNSHQNIYSNEMYMKTKLYIHKQILCRPTDIYSHKTKLEINTKLHLNTKLYVHTKLYMNTKQYMHTKRYIYLQLHMRTKL